MNPRGGNITNNYTAKRFVNAFCWTTGRATKKFHLLRRQRMVPTHSIQGIKVFLNIGWRYAKPLKRDVKTGYKSKVTNPRELMEKEGLRTNFGTSNTTKNRLWTAERICKLENPMHLFPIENKGKIEVRRCTTHRCNTESTNLSGSFLKPLGFTAHIYQSRAPRCGENETRLKSLLLAKSRDSWSFGSLL